MSFFVNQPVKEVASMMASIRSRRRLVWLLKALMVCAVAVLGLVCGFDLAALRAAGLAGGSAISGVAGFFSALTGNLVWLGVTVIGFAVTLIAILFLSGHSRAHDVALKVGIGIFLLIAAPGIVA